jgi:HSP20 family protein
MTLVRRPSPFSELVTLRQAMDQLFDDTLFRPFTAMGEAVGRVPLDVRTTPDALVIQAALPGIRPEDVDITVENGTLAIRAEHRTEREDEESGWLVREIARGGLMRSVSLPNGLEADKTEATFENGVLTLRIPKAEQVKPRQIQIRPVSSGEARAVEAGGTAGATGDKGQ